MKIPLSQIIIRERQRKDLGDVSLLAESLRDRGQIHSIGINERNELIWGRRRLEAARTLGWQEIEASQRSGLTEIDEQLIEFEEDVRRKNRSWQEECLACTKIFKLLKREKAKNGENWTYRAMASFTGMEKSSIGYMVQVGEALAREPKDDRVWLCENYTNAVKLLLQRTEEELNKEIIRRRATTATPVTAGQPPSVVQQLDKTSPSTPLAEVTIRIHGINKSFDSTVPDEDYGLGMNSFVIAYQPKILWLPKIIDMLRPAGWAVLWFEGAQDRLSMLSLPNAHAMPWPLVWNKVSVTEPTPWPFSPNYAQGYVITKQAPTAPWPNALTSTVSCLPTGNTLPAAVLDHSINNLANSGMAVMAINNANPVAIAELGFVPMWFEPDKAVFDKQVAALVEFYEENIPNVKVIV